MAIDKEEMKRKSAEKKARIDALIPAGNDRAKLALLTLVGVQYAIEKKHKRDLEAQHEAAHNRFYGILEVMPARSESDAWKAAFFAVRAEKGLVSSES